MRLTSTAVLAVIAGGLFGYIYFVERHQSSTDQKLAKKARLVAFERAHVRGLTLERAGEKPLIIVRHRGEAAGAAGATPTGPAAASPATPGPTAEVDNDRYQITAPFSLPADRGAVGGLVGTLEFLEPRRTLKDARPDQPDLGLTRPRLVVTVRLQAPTEKGAAAAPERSVKLRFGGTSPTGDAYVTRDDEPTVYLVEKRHFEALDRGPAELRDARLVPVGREAVTALSWTTVAGEKVTLDKDPAQGWSLVEPLRMRASRERIDALLRKLEDLKSSRLITARVEGDGSAHGVSATSRRLLITAGSVKRTLWLGSACPASGAAKAEGAPPDAGKPALQVVVEGGEVVCVPTAALDDLMEPSGPLRELRLVQGPEAEVSRLVLERGGRTLTLERRAGLWYRASAKVAPARKPIADGGAPAAPAPDEADRADATVVRKLFEELTTFRALDVKPVNARAQGLEKPGAQLRCFDDKGALREALLIGGAADGSGRRWVRRGTEAVALVAHAELEGKIEPDFLRFRRRQVLSFNRFDAKRLTVAARGGQEEVLEHGDQGWRLSRPVQVAADADLTDRVVGLLTDLSAERFVTEKPLPEHRLGERTVRLEVEPSLAAAKGAADGGAAGARATYVLELGATTSDGCYARAGKGTVQGPVFVLKKGSCADLHQPLATRRPLTLDEAKLTRVVLGGSERKGELVLEKRGPDWFRAAGEGADAGAAEQASKDRMTELVAALRELRAVNVIGYGEAPATAALETPRVLVRFTVDGQERTLAIGAPVPADPAAPPPAPSAEGAPVPAPAAYARVSGVAVTFALPGETVERLTTLAP